MASILDSAFCHESAVALVVDGQIVAAAVEERFTRKKHDEQLPVNAIEWREPYSPPASKARVGTQA